jgi:hypothetical protein
VLEDEKLKKIEDERLAQEELERLIEEENKLQSWKLDMENTLIKCYDNTIQKENWDKYSNCEEGYINVRKEKDLNGFLYDFKSRCDTVKKKILNYITLFRTLFIISN